MDSLAEREIVKDACVGLGRVLVQLRHHGIRELSCTCRRNPVRMSSACTSSVRSRLLDTSYGVFFEVADLDRPSVQFLHSGQKTSIVDSGGRSRAIEVG